MKRTVGKKTTSEKSTAAASRHRRPKWSVSGTPPAPAGKDAPYFLRTISRALDVLEAFDEHRTHLTLQELSRIVGAPSSSLFRLLATLQSRNYLQQNDDGAYQLSAKVLHGRLYEQAERFRR